jgi:hypothetical protein
MKTLKRCLGIIARFPLMAFLCADVTAALGFRKLQATTFANNTIYYFATLHGAGGSILASTTDAWTGVGMAGELATGNGYIQGGKALLAVISGCTATAGSSTVTVPNADTLLSIGQAVVSCTGTGVIGASAVITTIFGSGSSAQVTFSFNATSSGTCTLTIGGASVASNTNVDLADVYWTATGGTLGPASYVAYWANSSNTITGAKLVAVKDSSASPQSASVGQPLSGSIANLVVF